MVNPSAPEPEPPVLLWKGRALCDWIKAKTPEWASQSIESWDDAIEPACGVFALEFLERTQRAVRSVDVRQIVGASGDYVGRSWADAITESERSVKMRACLEMADSAPWYYFRPIERGQMSLVSFQHGQWFSCHGIHRVIVAKFLHAYYHAETGIHPLLHSVPTITHVVDHSTLQSYLTLHRLINEAKLPITLSVKAGVKNLSASTEDVDVFDECRILVRDKRLSAEPLNDSRVLTPVDFRAYAAWVCETAGVLSRRDRWRYAVGRMLSMQYDVFSLVLGSEGVVRR